jgi:hypothetical protein
MPKKGKTPSRKPKIRKPPPSPPEPSIPPPDNPELRDESKSLREESTTPGEQAAKLRLKALEQARKMPTSNKKKPDDEPGVSSSRESHEDEEAKGCERGTDDREESHDHEE